MENDIVDKKVIKGSLWIYAISFISTVVALLLFNDSVSDVGYWAILFSGLLIAVILNALYLYVKGDKRQRHLMRMGFKRFWKNVCFWISVLGLWLGVGIVLFCIPLWIEFEGFGTGGIFQWLGICWIFVGWKIITGITGYK